MSIRDIKMFTKNIGAFLIGLEIGLLIGGVLTITVVLLILGFVISLAVIDVNLKESNAV